LKQQLACGMAAVTTHGHQHSSLCVQGMEYLHGKSIVHFDVKTANVLIGMRDKSPIAKIADFGLSKRKQQTYVTGEAAAGATSHTAPLRHAVLVCTAAIPASRPCCCPVDVQP
jgi:serine/threonine protein kinase